MLLPRGVPELQASLMRPQLEACDKKLLDFEQLALFGRVYDALDMHK